MNSLIECSHADFGYENQDAVVDVTMLLIFLLSPLRFVLPLPQRNTLSPEKIGNPEPKFLLFLQDSHQFRI